MDANDAKTGELTPHAGPQACEITGLILAGGLGTRMGGVDKGLQGLNGHPLVWHALQRMRPQVGPLAINANRHLAEHATFGVPVWPDASADRCGPLAGVLAGLSHCATPWLATVPCDSPCFPTDLVARLAQAAAESDAQIAMAATREADGSLQPQPVHSLLHASLRDSLAAFIAAGQRKVDRWTAQHRTVTVVFEDAQAFFNANTPADLERLHRRPPA
jgi:molybdopterin-guanine dinucleotide biosynthesis protein A